MSVFKRKRKNPDGTVTESDTYYIKFDYRGEQYPRKTPYTRREDAEKFLNELKRATTAGEWQSVKSQLESLRLRKTAPLIETTSLEQLRDSYRRHSLIIHKEANIRSLRLCIIRAYAAEDPQLAQVADRWLTYPVSILNESFVWKWRQAIADSVADASREDRARTFRSANSTFTQARSLFTPEIRSAYFHYDKITLPDTIDGFLKAPLFPEPLKKADYKKPSDTIISKTFDALEVLGKEGAAGDLLKLNMYRAIWLALGFALRKSEAAAVKTSWFILRDGKPYLAGDKLSKDGLTPDIKCHNGAWERLVPVLPKGDGDRYVIEGTDTERQHEVFKRIGHWMTALGWKTQKRYHEFRAWAICQVILAHKNDLYAGQRFARHATIQTTEQNYGRYLTDHPIDTTLQLPTIQTPKIQIYNP